MTEAEAKLFYSVNIMNVSTASTTVNQTCQTETHTYCLDGDVAEILLGDIYILDLRGETSLDEELQQGGVVGRGPL